MFEGIVVDVLLKYLGEYIKDLNKEQLKIGLFSGNVILKDLEVKGEALDSFNLPVTVKKGVLGKLELRVPWKNLKTQPVVVLLDNIFILVEKQNQFEYDEEEAIRRKKNSKKKRLENYEAKSEGKEVKDEDKKEKSFSEKLVTKILDNLQILINKIHIRFEDEHEDRTFALGLTIDRISLQSTDDQWKPKFVETITSTVIMKLVELSDLSVYMDTGTKSLRNLNHSQFCDTFSRLIPTSQNLQGHKFLIRPISAWLKLTLANNRGKVDMDIPKATISAALEELSLSLEESQYHALLDLLESINFYVQETKYLKFRPKERPTKDPRGWWRYAGNVVLEKIRERLNRTSWTYVIQRSKIRREYIQLYKSFSGVKWHTPLTKVQTKRLEELDDINSFEDIVYFRSLAKAELNQEAQNAERRAEYKKMKKKTKKKSRFISALFSSDDKKKSKHKDPSDIGSPKIDKEKKKELKIKDKEEKKKEKGERRKYLKDKIKGLSSPVPLSAARLQMHTADSDSPRLGKVNSSEYGSEFSETSRSEMDSDEEQDGEAPGILLSPHEKQMLYETIGFDQAIAGVTDENLPPEYIKTKLNIDVGRVSFSLIGMKADDTLGPLAVFGINDIAVALEKRPENMRLNLTVDNIEATDMLISNPKYSRLIAPSKKRMDNRGHEGEKFIQFSFEKNPLDGHCDLMIRAKMSPLDIIVNASSMVHFYQFFRPPQPVAVWALAGKGKRQWHDIKKRTRHQLMDVIKNRKSIDLSVDARAPTIFIPADTTQTDTVVAIADLGKIRITSELPNRDDLDSDDPDYENAFYDKFRFSVTGIRVLATTENDQGWQDPEHDNYALYDFVHTDVNLLMEKSINPHDTTLTQMRLSGDLPLLRVHFSTRKLGLVVQLANDLDAHLAPLRDMAGGFKTRSMLEEGKRKGAKGTSNTLNEMVSGIEDEEERELVKEQLLAQKQIEVKFSIASVEVELYQTTDAGIDQIIAKLQLVGLSLDLAKQMYSLHGEIMVQGMQLQDFVTQTNDSKFKNLIYSSEQLHTDNSAPLIQGSFLKLDQNSPDFGNTMTTLSFNVASLFIAINPPAIVTIMSLVNDCISATTQRIATEAPQTLGSSPLVQSFNEPVNRVNLLSKVKVDITMQTAVILLNAGGTHLATFSVSGIDMEVDVKEDKTMDLRGGVREINLTDETAAATSKPHIRILRSDDLDGDSCVTIGFFKLPPPPPVATLSPNETLVPHARLELFAKQLHITMNQGFLLQLLSFSIPFLDLLPGKAVAAAIPRSESAKKPKTYNTLVSPFKKETKKPAKNQISDRRRMQLDIKAESLFAFLPENDLSKSGLIIGIPAANLLTSFHTESAPVLDSDDYDEDEEEEKTNEIIITVNRFDIGANGLELHILNVDNSGKEVRTDGISGVDVKMNMEFIFGQVPKSITVPSKRINILVPTIKLATNPEKMGIIFKGIMKSVDFSKVITTAIPKKNNMVKSLSSSTGFTPPASPVLGFNSPSLSRGRSISSIAKNHLALINRLAIKIDIVVNTIEVGAEQDGAVFSEVELKTMLLTIEIKENRHVVVIGKLTHLEVYDVMPANVDGKLVPRKETVVVEQALGDPIMEFNVSKKRDAAAYVDLQFRPLFITISISFFGKLLPFVLPLSQSFKYSKEGNQLPSIPAISIPAPRPMLPLSRSNTARELPKMSPSISSSPPSPPISALQSPKAIRPSRNERTLSFNQLPSSPLRSSPSSRAISKQQKSFFRLRVENTVATITVPEMGGTMTVEVGTLLVFNEMTGAKNSSTTPRGSKLVLDDEDDIANELQQIDQARKLVVRTSRVSARVCDLSDFNNTVKGYLFKDAQFEVGVEVRDNEHDKTGTIPKRKVLLQSTELIFMLTQFDYTMLMIIINGLVSSLVKKAKPVGSESSNDTDTLNTEVLIDLPDLQLSAKGESSSIASLRLNGVNFAMKQYASKAMKLEALVNSLNIIDTRPGICTEFSGLIHGKQDNTKPMIQFNMERIPSTGTMNILFNLDHLRVFANMFAFSEIMDFFLPALTEKLLPTFMNKKDSTALTKKPAKRILSITADIKRMKLYVLSDYYNLTSGVLAVKMDAGLEFVDRNRDAKISLRLQNLQMGTVHHHISSQKASVLHSASIDFVMSNSQGTATSITLSLDTLPLFLSPQDIILMLTLIADLRPAIPQLKSKFKNLKKPKEKQVNKEEVEKEEVLVISCIGGIIITAMNDHMGRALPMAEIRITQLSAQISNWTAKNLELETNLVLLVEYFNSSIMAFEPLVEKWPLCVTLKQASNPKFTLSVKSSALFNLNVTHACGQMLINSYDVVAAVAAQAAKIFKKKKKDSTPSNSSSLALLPSPSGSLHHVESTTSLPSVASTASLSEVMDEIDRKEGSSTPTARDAPRHPAHILARLNSSGARSATPPPSNSPTQSPNVTSPLLGVQPIRKVVANFHPYWIFNQTGYSVSYVTDDERTSDGIIPSRLADRLRFPMENVRKNTGRTRNFRQSEEENSLHMTMRIPFESSPVRRIPIDTLGSYFFRAGNNMQERMCCEVAWNDDGSKNVIVRSCVVVRNFTDVPLEFRVSEGSDVRTLGPQARGESFALPVQLARGQLMIRPSSGNFRTNDILSLAELQAAIETDNYTPSHSRNNLADLLDKTSSASVENKLLGLMNKTTLTHPNQEKEESITRTITCMSQAKVPHLFVLQITRGPAFNNNSSERQMYINIYPPLILENSLPHAIQFSDPNNQIVVDLDSGAETPVYVLQQKKNVAFFLTGIPNFPTSKHILINYEAGLTPIFPQKLRLVDTSHTHAPLDLQLFTKEEAPGVYKITIYSSAWLINNTQMPLLYKVPKVYEITDATLGLAPGQNQRIAEQVDEKPFLYAYDKLKIQVPGSAWSKKFSIATIGKIIVVQMFSSKGSSERTEFRFRVSIRFGEGKFQRTRMVTISPHYVIVNLMSVPLLYRQSRAKLGEIKDVVTSEEPSYSELAAGESKYFHWPQEQCNKHLIITRSDGNHEWSGPFAIDDVGDVTLKLRHRHKSASMFPRAEVIDSPTSVFVLIHPENPAHPPFIIENFTDRSIRYQQENGVHTDSLGPGERVSYAWDEPLDVHALLIDYWGEKGEHGRMRCKISKIVPFKPLKVEQQTVYGYMHVSGPTRVLTLTHDRQLYESQGAKWDGSGGLVEHGEWDITINIPGIGVSLVDNTPKELLLLSIHGISLMYAKSNIYTTAEVVFDFMQIDNQLPQTDYPVLLYHTKPKDLNEKNRPFLHFSCVRRMNVELNFFEYAGLLVQEINVMVEDSLLNSILDMVLSLSRQLKNNSTFSQSRNSKASKKKKALYTSNPTGGKMIYFKLLHLNPIKVSLSFTFVPEGILSQSSGFLGNFGMTFGQLERAPICLNALLLEHPFTPKRPLVSRIKAHYIRQALNQLYKAVGSSETFGNPVGLFNNLGTGFKDFFYEPAQGFVRSPQEFGRGLAKGSLSLLKNSVYGLFNTISKIMGAFGKGFALLSLDPEYLNHRRTSERKQPKHLGEGLLMGAQGLGLGIFDGVTGVVRKPIEGALTSGPSGFAKGVVQGVVGVAVKPVAGVMDLATKTTEGIKNTTNLFKAQRRVRPPRAFAKGKVLIEYSLDESEGRFILDNTNEGQFKHDSLIYTMRHGKFISVITNQRILGVSAKNYNFIFQVPFAAIKRVEMVKTGVKLRFYEAQPILLLLDRRTKYIIEIDDKDQILLLCIMLRDCIRAAGM